MAPSTTRRWCLDPRSIGYLGDVSAATHRTGGDKGLTLEFDVAMDKGDAMHPPDGLAQFTPYLSQVGFAKLRVLLVRIDEVEQLGSVDVLQHEAVVGRCRKRVHEGDDVGVADMLETEVGLEEWKSKQRMTYPKNFDLPDEAHPCPIVNSAVRQFNRHQSTTRFVQLQSIRCVLDWCRVIDR